MSSFHTTFFHVGAAGTSLVLGLLLCAGMASVYALARTFVHMPVRVSGHALSRAWHVKEGSNYTSAQ